MDLTAYLRRHHCGDWGDLDDEDKQANEDALATAAGSSAATRTADGERLYIITEADR